MKLASIIRCLKTLVCCLILGTVHQVSEAQASGPPSTNCHVTDGKFTTCPGGKEEWSDVTPVSFPASDSYLYVNQDATHSFLYLMYDFPVRTTPIAATESVHVSFYTVEQDNGSPILITYDVYIMGNGQMEILQQGKQTPPGRISSTVGFGASPNSSTPHVTAELQVPLTAGPPSTYSDDPLYWSASVPSTPPPPPDPPTCPNFFACLKTQGEIDDWTQEALSADQAGDLLYSDTLQACDEFGQEAQSSTAAFAQASLANETRLFDAQLNVVATAANKLTSLADYLVRQFPPDGSPGPGDILPFVIPSVLQAANALRSLAALAPISSLDLYVTVNLNTYVFTQNLARAALAAAEFDLAAATAAGSAFVAEVLAPLAAALAVAVAAFDAGVALEVLFAEAVQAVAQAVTAACEDVSNLAAAPLYAEAAYYALLAEDPADPNFTVIATPMVPTLPSQPLTTATGFSQQVVNDLNAFITNTEKEISLLRVIPTSVNRVAGAVAANNNFWQVQQANAVRQYAAELIPLANNESTLRTNLANDLKASGINFTFTANTVFNFLGPLQNGLPSGITTTLTQLGVDTPTQASILKEVSAVSPDSVATLGNGAFPAALTDPALTAATAGAVNALNSLATSPPVSALSPSFKFTIPGDYASAGIGLRGQTSGDISLTGIPSGASIVKAYLYFAYLDNGEDASLSTITMNGTPITASLIGLGPDTCWGDTNSFTFRADVTPYVSGNGTYALTNVASGGAILAEGASLVAVYQLAGLPVKTVMIDDGNIAMPFGSSSGSASFGNFIAANPVSAATTFIVGDGQEAEFGIQTPTSFTGNIGTINFPNLFNSLEGSYWDDVTFNVSSVIGAGSDTGSANITIAGDCLLWSAQAFSVSSTTVSTPLTATAGLVQANADGNTVVNLRGLAPSDAPTLEEQVLAIVQFRIIQNPSLSAVTLTKQLISGLLSDGVISPSEAATVESQVNAQLVLPITTTTTLVANPSTNLVAGGPISLTATVVAASGTAIPVGTVTFADPAGGSATVALDGTGKAVYTGKVPKAGTYSVFASYNGAPGFAGSASSTITKTVTAPSAK